MDLEAVAKTLWNAAADEHNQWDDLGQDEKHDFITKILEDFGND
jgi:hypothetical protein